MMVVFFAILYALGSMVLGGMLILARVQGGYTTEVLWGNALGTGAWNYPGFLLVAPWGILSLPFLATWSMIFVSIGVGIGIAVAILITVRLIRDGRRRAVQPGGVGAVAGLTPAMIALVTLGACCSTTAAATAGVGLVAQASGSTLDNLLINNWYLDVFQVVIIGVALLAQEVLLEIYGGLFGLAPVTNEGAPVALPPRLSPRTIAVGALRGALLVAGVTWSLAMLAEWTTTSPSSGSAVLWFQWLFQHQWLGILAVAVALFPAATSRAFLRGDSLAWGLRIGSLVAGASLAIGTPPTVALAGAPGFVNELLAVLGAPPAWGAVSPVFPVTLSLYLRWGFQYLLLGGFALAAGVAPRRSFAGLEFTRPSEPMRARDVPTAPAPTVEPVSTQSVP